MAMMAALLERLLQNARARIFGRNVAIPALEVAGMAGMTAEEEESSADSIFDGLFMAAPKSKVSRSRKRIRNNAPTKRLTNIVHFQDCPICGEKKLRHRLCMSCYKKGRYFVSAEASSTA